MAELRKHVGTFLGGAVAAMLPEDELHQLVFECSFHGSLLEQHTSSFGLWWLTLAE